MNYSELNYLGVGKKERYNQLFLNVFMYHHDDRFFAHNINYPLPTYAINVLKLLCIGGCCRLGLQVIVLLQLEQPKPLLMVTLGLKKIRFKVSIFVKVWVVSVMRP